MPTRAPRQRAEQQRALDTINVVILATVKRLEDGGEAAVNIKDLSAETGVSYGAIYHHFKDRDGLIRAAQFERLRQQPGGDIVALGAALDTQGDLVDFVLAIRAIAMSIADPQRAKVRLVRSSVISSSLKNGKLYSLTVKSVNSAGVSSATGTMVKVIPGFTLKATSYKVKKSPLLTSIVTTPSKGVRKWQKVSGSCVIRSGRLVLPKTSGTCRVKLSVAKSSSYPAMSTTVTVTITK
jgi:hypothetical protein